MEGNRDSCFREPPFNQGAKSGGQAQSRQGDLPRWWYEPMPLSGSAWFAIVIVVCLCVLDLFTFHWWLTGPELAPNLPGFQKLMKQPALLISRLIVTIPCLIYLVNPKLRRAPYVLFMSGIFGCQAILVFVYRTFISGSVGIPLLYIIICLYLYRSAREHIARQHGA